MKLILQKSNSCFITSFAMLMDMTVDEVIEEVGHDGHKVVHPDLPGPYRYNNFHIQEFMDVAMRCGVALILIERNPVHASSDELAKKGYIHQVFDDDKLDKRIMDYLYYQPALIIGRYPGSKNRHCMAWDGESLFDPADNINSLDNFEIDEVWLKFIY